MSDENDKEHASQLNRQLWEPAGVVSVVNDVTTPNYVIMGERMLKEEYLL